MTGEFEMGKENNSIIPAIPSNNLKISD